MHESSLARRLTERALREAQAHGGGRITVIRVRMGPEEHLDGRALAFWMEAWARGTPAEGAQVLVTQSPVSGVLLESISLEEA